MALKDWEYFDAKTIAENYEDLAKEIEHLTGAKDNHFDTIMNFINEYQKLMKERDSQQHDQRRNVS